jgi:hypothetical protein
MLTEEQQFLIKVNLLKAQRLRLDSFDIVTFDRVPHFIVEAFFGKCTYKKRILVSIFGYLNGILPESILEMVQWKDKEKSDVDKVQQLMTKYLPTVEYQQRYYSYNIITGTVMYLDGKLRLHGKRIE